jgi:hypothetical protein
LPGAAQGGGVRPGEQQLGVGGHDKADPPAGLGRGADLGGGEPDRGDLDAAAVWAGEDLDLITAIEPAADLLARLAKQAETALASAAGY